MVDPEQSNIPKEGQAPEQSKGGVKRRDLLRAMGVIPAAALISSGTAQAAGSMPMLAPAQAAAKAYQRKILNEHEWKTVSMLSDIIIPADEKSGSATQAGVPEFIDDWLDFRGGELMAQIRGGLTWLDMECNRLYHHDFIACNDSEKKQILDRISYPKTAALEDSNAVAFFNHLRDLVVGGFFSSKMGVADLPYLGNQVVHEWKGCPPEVLDKLGVKYDDKA
jgi:Gluconate 2-dehydrogenase subunit 3